MKRIAQTERATETAREEKTAPLANDPDYMAKLEAKWKKDAEEAKTGSIEGKITDVIPTTAGLVYGDKAKDPDRPVLHCEITASDGKVFHETFSQPEGASSWRNTKFKLAQFLLAYNDLPKVGLTVKVGFSEDGFYKLVI